MLDLVQLNETYDKAVEAQKCAYAKSTCEFIEWVEKEILNQAERASSKIIIDFGARWMKARFATNSNYPPVPVNIDIDRVIDVFVNEYKFFVTLTMKDVVPHDSCYLGPLNAINWNRVAHYRDPIGKQGEMIIIFKKNP